MSEPLLDSTTERAVGRRPPRFPRILLSLVAVLALGAAACGGDSGSDALADLPEVADSEYTDATGEDAVTVQARDNSFAAQYLTVTVGTEITFDNRGRNPHNVIAVQEGAFTDIPTEDLGPGDTSSIVFDEVGEFPYYCSLHATPSRGMTGRIRVVAE